VASIVVSVISGRLQIFPVHIFLSYVFLLALHSGFLKRLKTNGLAACHQERRAILVSH
jgi:hypothetical protein